MPVLLQHLEQPLVLRHAEMGLVQLQRGVLPGLLVLQQPLGLGQQAVHHPGLLPHQLGDLAVELRVLVVGLVADGARDDERRPRLVDEDRVHLVDDRVGVLPLHPLLQREHHVVAQVVEAELVVGAVGDVRLIGGAAAGRRRLRVVQAGDVEAEVGVDVPHPLRVAPGQVVVDRDQVRAPAGERVQVERQGRDQRLAFASRHLRDPALMQHDAADELHVVRHHVPGQLVAGDRHGGADQPAAGLAHRGIGLGKEVVQRGLQLALVLDLQLLVPALEPVPLHRIRAGVLGGLDLLQLGLDGSGPLAKPLPELPGLVLQLGLAEPLELLFLSVDPVHNGLEALALALVPGPQDRGHQ